MPGDTNQRRKRKEREKNMNWSVYLLLIKGWKMLVFVLLYHFSTEMFKFLWDGKWWTCEISPIDWKLCASAAQKYDPSQPDRGAITKGQNFLTLKSHNSYAMSPIYRKLHLSSPYKSASRAPKPSAWLHFPPFWICWKTHFWHLLPTWWVWQLTHFLWIIFGPSLSNKHRACWYLI